MISIKARGRPLDGGRVIYGYYVGMDKTTYCFKEDYERNPPKRLHYIIRDEMTDWGLPNEFRLYEVDSESVEIYTGLKDMKGIEIYEGDEVVGLHGHLPDVEYHGIVAHGEYYCGPEHKAYGFYIQWFCDEDGTADDCLLDPNILKWLPKLKVIV